MTPDSFKLGKRPTQSTAPAPVPSTRGGRGRGGGRGETTAPHSSNTDTEGGGPTLRGRGGARGSRGRGRGRKSVSGAQNLVKSRTSGRGKLFPDDEGYQEQTEQDNEDGDADEMEKETNGQARKRKRDTGEAFHFPNQDEDAPPYLDTEAASTWIYPCMYRSFVFRICSALVC